MMWNNSDDAVRAMVKIDDPEMRVLILAPRGRNAPLIQGALRRAQIESYIAADLDALCQQMAHPTGIVLVSEEGLNREGLNHLVAALGRQPPWSEIPVLVLTGRGSATRGSFEIVQLLGPRGNVNFLERPTRILTLITAVRAALRVRQRQYELRDLLTREQAARAQAEDANRAKDHFLATLSHELRTPLNPVLMTVSSMAQDRNLPEYLREDVDIIRRNINLESKLIDDLLDLTRIARGKIELHFETIDVHQVLAHALATCWESGSRDKHLTVSTQLKATRHFVWGDDARLTQIFWNLIRNAIKFTPENGSIVLSTENTPDGLISVAVTDTGIGIHREALGRIFNAFEQESRGITRRFGGLGLGLAICKALVEHHGGTIAVFSEGKDQGSKFTIRMAALTAPPNDLAKEVKPQPDPLPPSPAMLRILIVEDHEATALVMSKLLRNLGYQVIVADSVAQARDTIDAHVFDLVISDLGLPDGSGLLVIKYLRLHHQTPAIAVSGYGMEEDINQAHAAGFDAHLVKPLDITQLQSQLIKVLARHRSRTAPSLRGFDASAS